MKKALVRALSSARDSVSPLIYSGYLPLLFLFEALRGLSFLASPVPFSLLTWVARLQEDPLTHLRAGSLYAVQ
jgi:hypothetical protein